MIYNLLRRGNKTLPKPPNYQNEQEQITKLLLKWNNDLLSGQKFTQKQNIDNSDDSDIEEHSSPSLPKKLIYLLEHAYTSEGLSFTH